MYLRTINRQSTFVSDEKPQMYRLNWKIEKLPLHLLFLQLASSSSSALFSFLLSNLFHFHCAHSHYPSSPLPSPPPPPPPLCLSPLSFVLIRHQSSPTFLSLSPSLLLFYSHSAHLSPLFLPLPFPPLVVNQSWLGAERAERSSPVDQCL